MRVESIDIDIAEIFKPTRKQAEWLTNDALFRLYLGGVGSGKSWALTLFCVLQQIANPNTPGALLGRTYVDLNTVLLPLYFDHLDKLQAATGINWIKDYNKGQSYCELITGSRLWLRPYNRIDKLRGLEVGFGAADESEFSEADPGVIWQVLTGRMRARCPRPGLAFASSPNGLRGITKKFHHGQLTRDPRFWVTCSTSLDNPYLPDYYFEALQSMSKRRYAQEVEGKVLRPLTSVYSITSSHYVDWNWRRHPSLPSVIGVDWGGEDHHVAALAQILEDGTWIWCDELIVDDASRGKFRKLLRAKIDKEWNRAGTLKLFGVDRAAPLENNWLRGLFGPRGVIVRWADTKHAMYVHNGIEMVRDALDPAEGSPKMLFAKSLPRLVKGKTAGIIPGLLSYRYKADAEGNPTTIPHKDNISDHICDALRYAWIGSARLPDLHGGRELSRVGLGPAGDHQHPRSNDHRPHW